MLSTGAHLVYIEDPDNGDETVALFYERRAADTYAKLMNQLQSKVHKVDEVDIYLAFSNPSKELE